MGIVRAPPVKVEGFQELMGGDASVKHDTEENKLTSPSAEKPNFVEEPSAAFVDALVLRSAASPIIIKRFVQAIFKICKVQI